VVDNQGVIVCGHTRWLAAHKLGLTKISVHTASNLTPAQIKAYRLMDNRSHRETAGDFDLLSTELLELTRLGPGSRFNRVQAREIDSLLVGGRRRTGRSCP
jgi:ParB-like chromosome segregation protein Spo0J